MPPSRVGIVSRLDFLFSLIFEVVVGLLLIESETQVLRLDALGFIY